MKQKGCAQAICAMVILGTKLGIEAVRQSKFFNTALMFGFQGTFSCYTCKTNKKMTFFNCSVIEITNVGYKWNGYTRGCNNRNLVNL